MVIVVPGYGNARAKANFLTADHFHKWKVKLKKYFNHNIYKKIKPHLKMLLYSMIKDVKPLKKLIYFHLDFSVLDSAFSTLQIWGIKLLSRGSLYA